MSKYDSLTDMLDKFGSVDKLMAYIDKRVELMKKSMTPKQFAEHVLIDRDAYIDSFELKEYDAFFQGLLYCNENTDMEVNDEEE